MAIRLMLLATLAMSLISIGLSADEKMANALADGGIDLIMKGKSEKGKELLFKALAYDADCPVALYELGKLFEAEGNSISAAQFLARAAVELAKRAQTNISFNGKKMDCDRRLRLLNPYNGRFLTLLEEYAVELTKISQKFPDSLTLDDANQRVSALRMADVLPKEKMPKIQKALVEKNPNSNPKTSKSSSSPYSPSESSASATGVTPEVERALKQAGWTTIKGSWKKVGDNIYEVTNGSLEATKTIGGIRVLMHNSDKGTLSILVRNSPSHKNYPRIIGGFGRRVREEALGYGIITKGNEAQIYAPEGGWGFGASRNDDYYPSFAHACPLIAGKNLFSVTVSDTEKVSKLEIYVNGKREKLTQYKIARDGPFVLQIEGTLTIEAPQAAG